MSTSNNPNSSINDVVVTKSGGTGGDAPSANIGGRAQPAAAKAAQSAAVAKAVAGQGDVAGLVAPYEAGAALPIGGEKPARRIPRRKKAEDEDQNTDRAAGNADAESGEGIDPAAMLSEDAFLLAQADTGAGAGTGGATASGAGTAATAGAGATAATAATAAGISTAGMIAIGAVAIGVAAAGGGGSSTAASAPAAPAPEVPAPAPPAPDTTAPVIQSMSAQAGAVVLTYNEALDTVNIPVAGNFAVTVNGAGRAVTGVAVAGTKVTLTLATAVVAGDTVNVTYTDPTGANDVAAIQDAAGNDAVSFTTGVVADGYIRGAQIYIDTNNNGLADASEALAGVVTNANGNFILPAGSPTGVIMATGGLNIDTGVPNTMVLKAPAGSTVVSPLTTLVQALITKTSGTSVATASADVVAALGLPIGTNLSSYDPLAVLAATPGDANALAVQTAAVQVATLVSLAAASANTDANATTTTTAAGATVISNLATAIKTAVAGATTVDLMDAATITAAITGAVDTVNVPNVTTAIDTANTAIDGATTLAGITTAQAIALDNTAPAAPTSLTLTGTVSDTGTTGDNMTNDSTPLVRVNFNNTATDGTAAVIGNIVTIYEAATLVGTATALNTTDVANGYIDVTLTTALTGEGSHALTAKIADIASNTSTSSTAYTLSLDTTAPTTAPTVALTTDSGSSATDNITKVGTLNVGGIDTGNTVQYSIDAGTTWTSSFTAATDVNNVLVRQADAAGNGSQAANLSFTYDTTIATPTVSLTTNSGSTTDSISNSAALTLSAAAGDVTRSITINGGTASGTYTAPTTDGAYTVVVTDTDTAGNTANATLSFTFDTTSPSFTSAATANFAENGTGTAYATVATDTNLVTSYAISGGADAALFNINAATGAITFATAPNFEAPADAGGDNVYNLTLTATDTANNTTGSAHAVAITVTNVNEAPTLISGATASFAENGTGMAYMVMATDPDAGTTFSYALAGTDAARFAISASSGVVTFATAPNFEAATDSGADNIYNITVTASDGTNTTAAQAVAITVTNVNETPVITSAATANFAENGTGTAYTVTATDPDAGTTLTYALGGADAALFNLDTGTGAVTFKNAPNFEAKSSYGITVTASDGTNTTAAQAVTVSVTNINEAPAVVSGAPTTDTIVVNQALSGAEIASLFSDVDAGDTLTYSATGLPNTLTLNPSTGAITGTPTATGTANVTFTATDAGGLTASHAIAVSIVSAPAITAIAANVVQAKSGDTLTFTATLSEAVTITGSPTMSLTLDVGGQPMTATYTGNLTPNTLTFTAIAPGTVDDTSVTVTGISLSGATIVGNLSGQNFMTTATGQVVSNFIIDNVNPAFTSGATASFAENATGTVYTAATTDVTAVTYALSGTDASSFTLTNGVLTFNSPPNFEAKSSYAVTITATDALAHAASQNVAITVTNVNEAPSLTSGATSTTTLAVNQAFSNNITGLFSDVDGDTLTYSATGLPTGITLSAGVISGTPTAIGAASVVITATDGGGLTASHTVTVNVVTAPTLSSTIDNVTNFDVTSNIVLTASESVTAVAGKNITIINEGGTGFRGEATVNTQIIAANDTTKVSISGNTITINPGFDLDLANNYHIEVDAGAFVNGSGMGSLAVSSATAMNFSTVTPGTTSAPAASQAMTTAGGLTASFAWADIEGVGATSNTLSTNFDLSSGNIAMVFKDYATGAAGVTDGIDAPAFWVNALNFGVGDLLYIDNQSNANPNDLAKTTFGTDTPARPSTEVVFGSSTSGQAWIDISPTGASTSVESFLDPAALQLLLSTTYVPIVSG